ncbi:MAG TPA: ABC transporter ATP-binding protein [Terrimicrobiaceae bacterium]|nr:ABC transporter ATP-binding protein [Terrimicrobiaceae bacterium]
MSSASASGTINAALAPAIDVEGITKSFEGRRVVDGLAMRVNRGEIYGFLGPNGSGKTTFLRILCGLLRPDGGSGTCLGWDVLTQSDAIKRRVGYMTQKFSLYEDLSIAENLRFVADIYEIPHARQAVAGVLETLGLQGRGSQLAGQLSGGWKQRLALAACLIHQPELLLLDEPTAGVDPKARRDFWEEIHRLAARGLTVLVTTHYMDEAERCHRLAYIAYGKLLASGTMRDVLASARLSTWEVSGPHLGKLAEQLRGHPEIEQVTAFGSKLHVSSRDGETLENVVAPYRSGPHVWRKIEPGLEDAFIGLMQTSEDNFG